MTALRAGGVEVGPVEPPVCFQIVLWQRRETDLEVDLSLDTLLTVLIHQVEPFVHPRARLQQRQWYTTDQI